MFHIHAFERKTQHILHNYVYTCIVITSAKFSLYFKQMSHTNLTVSCILLQDQQIQCPYNRHHQIWPENMPRHLIKCRKVYAGIINLAICSIDATHHLPPAELIEHEQHCPSQPIRSTPGRGGDNSSPPVVWYPPPSKEEW